MRITISKCLGMFSLGMGLVAGCAVSDEASRIPVTERNALGVTTVEVDRYVDNGADVFELRGMGAGEQQLAAFRLRTGVIADLEHWLPDSNNIGSEITITSATSDVRMVTQEQQRFELERTADSAVAQFLDLPAVSSALHHEQVFFDADVKPSSEVELFSGTCPGYQVLNSPVAKQCCIGLTMTDGSAWSAGTYTETVRSHHVNPTGALVVRKANYSPYIGSRGDYDYQQGTYGNGCRASNGTGACSGTACYYGPAGFGVPVLTIPSPSTPYFYNFNSYTGQGAQYCAQSQNSTPPTPMYGDVTGSVPRTQGCPGGNSDGGTWAY